MQLQLEQLRKKALEEIAAVREARLLRDLEIKYLGRKGELTMLLRNIKNVSRELRPLVGTLANDIKVEIAAAIERQGKAAPSDDEKRVIDDETLPGFEVAAGHLHPITQFLRKVEQIFCGMGFEIVEGPEVELAKNNFDLLNIPRDHPARDTMDTFWIQKDHTSVDTNDPNSLLLRTHTSPVQIRAMKTRKPPVRLVVPGRCFRHEATDVSHETTFYQCEGLVIDRGVRITDLIGTLTSLSQALYGSETKTRARPHYYPFTEPSIDFDISCIFCHGRGCSVCGQSGWLEAMPSGMVHPRVLKNMHVDPEIYSGFAFGLGIDRMMMLYYKINDIRLSYTGDLRFLNQF